MNNWQDILKNLSTLSKNSNYEIGEIRIENLKKPTPSKKRVVIKKPLNILA